MSQPDMIAVSLDEDVIQSVDFIRTHNTEAEIISRYSFWIYASGVERDGDRYKAEWMRDNSKTSATVSDLLDRVRLATTTDATMLGHIQTVQEVAEENRNCKVWTEDGLFDVDRAYEFSCPTVEQSGELQ